MPGATGKRRGRNAAVDQGSGTTVDRAGCGRHPRREDDDADTGGAPHPSSLKGHINHILHSATHRSGMPAQRGALIPLAVRAYVWEYRPGHTHKEDACGFPASRAQPARRLQRSVRAGSPPRACPGLGTGPVLVHALDGFADAGNAVTPRRPPPARQPRSELVATFRADELIDYRSRRPVMDFSGQAFTGIEMPSLTVHAIRDNAGSLSCCLRRRAGPAVGAVHRGCPRPVRPLRRQRRRRSQRHPDGGPAHRPSTITAHGSDVEFLGDLPRWGSPMKLPASASMMLELRLSEHGYRTSWGSRARPHYLAQSIYLAAASRLLSSLASLTNLDPPPQGARQCRWTRCACRSTTSWPTT